MERQFNHSYVMEGPNEPHPVSITSEWEVIVAELQRIPLDPDTMPLRRVTPAAEAVLSEPRPDEEPEMVEPYGRHARRQTQVEEAEPELLPSQGGRHRIVEAPPQVSIAERVAAKKKLWVGVAMASCALAFSGVVSGDHAERSYDTDQASPNDTHSPAAERGMSWLALQHVFDKPPAEKLVVGTPADVLQTPAVKTPAPAAKKPAAPDFNPATYTLVGEDNVQKAFNCLVDVWHMTNEEAAGLIGNWKVESTKALQPTIVQNGRPSESPVSGTGYGLAQWTTQARQDRLKDFAKTQPAPYNSPANLRTQIYFAVNELNTTHTRAKDNLHNKVIRDPHASLAKNQAITYMIDGEAPRDHAVFGPNARIRGGYADQIIATMHLWAEKFKRTARK